MGLVMGLMLGSYEGMAPPIPLPGQKEMPAAPFREQMRAAFRGTASKSKYWGKYVDIS